jgi:hypothetical protein
MHIDSGEQYNLSLQISDHNSQSVKFTAGKSIKDLRSTQSLFAGGWGLLWPRKADFTVQRENDLPWVLFRTKGWRFQSTAGPWVRISRSASSQ